MKGNGKYFPLHEFLQQQEKEQVILSFKKMEEILQTSLPQSAYKYQAWWGNTRSGTYVQSAAWLEAGFRVEYIQFGEYVEFRKSAKALLTKKRSRASRKIEMHLVKN